jgi:uncharacterized protein (DUF427 family)
VESVWDYPRPPRVEPCRRRARVELGGLTVADSLRALRVLETSQAPGIYFPPDDVCGLEPSSRTSFCEWKGRAVYFDVVAGARRAAAAAWSYPEPVGRYAELRGYVAFYPQAVDACYLGDERVEPNAGDFYGGWITRDVQGPFKGGLGTLGW